MPAATSGGHLPSIHLDAVSSCHEGRAAPAPERATLTIEPGRLTVLTGPSGCGKTTLLSCLLGFAEATSGSITARPNPGPAACAGPAETAPALASGNPTTTRSNGRVVPPPRPRPRRTGRAYSAGFRRTRPCSPARSRTISASACPTRPRRRWPPPPGRSALDDVPLTRVLGQRGVGLSAGQCRRVALARALILGRPVLLLDEPTARLLTDRESVVIETLRRYAVGHAVLAVSHRPALIAPADVVVNLASQAPLPPATPSTSPISDHSEKRLMLADDRGAGPVGSVNRSRRVSPSRDNGHKRAALQSSSRSVCRYRRYSPVPTHNDGRSPDRRG